MASISPKKPVVSTGDILELTASHRKGSDVNAEGFRRSLSKLKLSSLDEHSDTASDAGSVFDDNIAGDTFRLDPSLKRSNLQVWGACF